jgi:hypothetical protein
MKNRSLLPIEKIEVKNPEFPDNYELQNKIKSPLSVLKYNLVYLFEDNYPAKMNPDFKRQLEQYLANTYLGYSKKKRMYVLQGIK